MRMFFELITACYNFLDFKPICNKITVILPFILNKWQNMKFSKFQYFLHNELIKQYILIINFQKGDIPDISYSEFAPILE